MLRVGFFLLLSVLPLFAEDDEEKAKAALKKFETAFEAKDEKEREAAIRALAKAPYPPVMEKLGSLAVSAEPDVLRVAAVETLTRFAPKQDLVRIVAAAFAPNQGREKVELAVLNALGRTEDPAAVGILSAYLADIIPKRDKGLASQSLAAVYSLERLHMKASLEAILTALKQNEKAPGVTAQGHEDEAYFQGNLDAGCKLALKRLLGQDWSNYDHWEKWWEENSGQYDDHLKKKQ